MSNLVKVLADRIVAAIALVIFSPLFLVVAILVRFNLGSPIFFTQLRPGKDGEIFTFYKFRTMTDKKDAAGKLLPDGDPREAVPDPDFIGRFLHLQIARRARLKCTRFQASSP